MANFSDVEQVETLVDHLTTLFLTQTTLSPVITTTAALALAQFIVGGQYPSEGELSAINLCLSAGGMHLKHQILELAPPTLKQLLP